jgi:hypothetical protein
MITYLISYDQKIDRYTIEPVNYETEILFTRNVVSRLDVDGILYVYLDRNKPEEALISAKIYFEHFLYEHQKIETVEDLKPFLYEMLEIIVDLNVLSGHNIERVNDRLVKLSKLFQNKE